MVFEMDELFVFTFGPLFVSMCVSVCLYVRFLFFLRAFSGWVLSKS